MKVKTLGRKENPAIVMIPGMFCNSDMPEIIGRQLEDEFYIILPTLDGHHREEPVYHSKETDGSEIKQWLQDNGITHLTLLQGTSMGAEVALETARQLEIQTDHYLYDGGPFFHFPGFFRAFMAKKFMKFVNMMRGRTVEEATDLIMQSSFVKKLGGDSLDSYRDVLAGFCETAQWIDKDSVRRIADTCYKCDLPDLPQDVVSKSVFLFSENEPARKSEKRLRKKYPDAEYVIAEGYGHGGYQTAEPEKYAAFVRNIAEGKDVPAIVK